MNNNQQSSNKITIISDPEGFEIKTKPTDKNKLYICGDITDSTYFMIPPDKEKISLLLKNKSYNLHNIKHCVENNSNVKLFFGNRDINKIKVKYLAKLKGTKTKINEYNNGEIDLTPTAYEDLKKELLNPKPFVVESMNAWYTFWSDGIGSGKNWKEEGNYTKFPFYERFLEIFGLDNAQGTMSAQNLLFTIPYEIFKDKLDITPSNIMLKPDDLNDFRAFIVLAIYRSMLLKPNVTSKKTSKNSSDYKGLLYKLFENNDLCSCECFCNGTCSNNNCQNIYIFSHGGITKKIIQNPELLNLVDNNINNLIDYNKINDPRNLSGGSQDIFYTISNKFSLDTVKNNITKINGIAKDAIKSLLDNDEILVPDQNMLFLLKISSPYNCELYKSKLKSQHQANHNCDLEYYSDLLSPIMPGIRVMREQYFFIPGKTVYQFFGHQPNGFGTVVEKFIDNTNHSYLVNLDVSLSFTGTKDNASFEESTNSVEIENNNVKVLSTIKHNLNFLKVSESSNTFFDFTGEKADKIITDYPDIDSLKKLNINFLIDDKLNDILDKFKELNTNSRHKSDEDHHVKDKNDSNSRLNKEDLPSNVYFSYNGKITNNQKNYIVFNVMQRANPKRYDNNNHKMPDLNRTHRFKFGKTYYILSDNKFNAIYDLIKPPVQPQPKQNGGTYKSKYLKYKQKYLELKKQMN